MIRRSLLFALVLLATVAAPVAWSAPQQSFDLEKTCDGVGTCTVTWSSTDALPAGTTETYLGPEYGDPVLSSRVLVATPGGGTAIGQCAWPLRSLSGTCTFAGGTGSLAGFHANLKVTANGDFSVFYCGRDVPALAKRDGGGVHVGLPREVQRCVLGSAVASGGSL